MLGYKRHKRMLVQAGASLVYCRLILGLYSGYTRCIYGHEAALTGLKHGFDTGLMVLGKDAGL